MIEVAILCEGQGVHMGTASKGLVGLDFPFSSRTDPASTDPCKSSNVKHDPHGIPLDITSFYYSHFVESG